MLAPDNAVHFFCIWRYSTFQLCHLNSSSCQGLLRIFGSHFLALSNTTHPSCIQDYASFQVGHLSSGNCQAP